MYSLLFTLYYYCCNHSFASKSTWCYPWWPQHPFFCKCLLTGRNSVKFISFDIWPKDYDSQIQIHVLKKSCPCPYPCCWWWWWCYISVRQPGPCITLRSASYTCNMTTLHVRRCQALICQNLPTVFNISKIRLTLHNYATIQHFNISNMLKTQSIIRLCIYSPVLFWFKSPIPWIQYTIFSVHHIHIPSHIFVFNKITNLAFIPRNILHIQRNIPILFLNSWQYGLEVNGHYNVGLNFLTSKRSHGYNKAGTRAIKVSSRAWNEG